MQTHLAHIADPKELPLAPKDSHRWRAMPVRAAALRALITLGPIIAAFAVGRIVGRALGPPKHAGEIALWWTAVMGSSIVTVAALERVTRRLLPLQMLLKLTMAFPTKAPKRFRIARRAGNVEELKRQFARMARAHKHADPNAAAEMVLSLVTALSAHDRQTRGHSERVRVYTDLLAESLSLPERDRDRLRWAALLHDIGKLGVSAKTLNKKGRPNKREWTSIRRHPDKGARMVAPLREWLGEWALAIEQHHERYDGEGYPRGLSGDQISLGGRIVAVADAFETMTAARSYKKPMGVKAAREELVRCSGTQFDPGVVRAFLTIPIRRIRWSAGLVPALAQVPLSIAPAVPSTVFGTIAVVGGSVLPGVTAAPVRVPPVHALPDPGTTVRTTSVRPTASTTPTPTPTLRLVTPTPSPTPTAEPSAPSKPTPPPKRAQGRPPVAKADDGSTNEDTPVAVDVLANDSDPDGDLDAQTLRVTRAPANGTAVVADGAVVYTPGPDFNGRDSFWYEICDLEGSCDEARVSVRVAAKPDAPRAADDTATTTRANSTTIAVLANDRDPDGDLDARSVTITAGPEQGSATVNQDGTVTYSSNPLFTGEDTFTYSVCDKRRACDTAVVRITVTG